MKKITVIFALFPFLIFTQITINKNDFANGGDTVRMSLSENTSINFSQTGANQIWNFSDLMPSSQVLDTFFGVNQLPLFAQLQYGMFAPINYQATFFQPSTDLPLEQLTFLPVTINDIFGYSKLSNDSLTFVGYSMVINGNEIPFKSDTIEKQYQFPMHYGDVNFSRGYTKIDMNPIYNAILIQHRIHTSEVDGWGQINTPYGNFNTLRIKHEISELDSVYATFNSFGMWIPLQVPLRRNYEWWTSNQKEPILKITTTEFQGSETITEVKYRDIYRGLDANLGQYNLNNLNIYPNPTSGIIQIDGFKEISDFKIYDLAGNNVQQGKILNSYLNVDALKEGVYFLQINEQNYKFHKL